EFYANAWRLDEHKNQPLTYTTQIRGTEINFSPKSIYRVLKLRDTPLPNATSYHDRKAIQHSIQAALPKRDWITLQRGKGNNP
ncbi:hypothetical protein PIB30_091411, partial [Stylosanthes scabra]|nr:hypothetical protein [Stylosanthes scabra]